MTGGLLDGAGEGWGKVLGEISFVIEKSKRKKLSFLFSAKCCVWM